MTTRETRAAGKGKDKKMSLRSLGVVLAAITLREVYNKIPANSYAIIENAGIENKFNLLALIYIGGKETAKAVFSCYKNDPLFNQPKLLHRKFGCTEASVIEE